MNLSRSPFFWIIWTGFSLFWIILVAYFMISTYIADKNEYEQLAAEGLWTEGEVLSRREKVSYDDDGDATTSYYVTFRYHVPDPALKGDLKRYEIEDSISYDLYSKMEKGRKIKLIYAESDPNIVRLEETFEAPGKTDLAIVFCAPMFGLPFLLLGLWQLKNELF